MSVELTRNNQSSCDPATCCAKVTEPVSTGFEPGAWNSIDRPSGSPSGSSAEDVAPSPLSRLTTSLDSGARIFLGVARLLAPPKSWCGTDDEGRNSMSSLSYKEKRVLEHVLGMDTGYVRGLMFSDRTFGNFLFELTEINIHDPKYQASGTSKANKFREFWKQEDDLAVAKVLDALLEPMTAASLDLEESAANALLSDARAIVRRLGGAASSTVPLKTVADKFDLKHLRGQIDRMEAAVEKGDTDLAIGTAKEVIETTCKTLLAEHEITFGSTDDIPTLTKRTLKVLALVPEDVPEAARGADVIRRLLNNLGSLGNSLAELRGLYGTGHGKHGKARGLDRRHARLAIGVAAAFCLFVWETNESRRLDSGR